MRAEIDANGRIATLLVFAGPLAGPQDEVDGIVSQARGREIAGASLWTLWTAATRVRDLPCGT